VKKIDRTMADDLVEKAVIRFIATFQDFTDKDGFFNIKPDLTVDLYKIGYALLDQFGEIIEGNSGDTRLCVADSSLQFHRVRGSDSNTIN
jgi:hypothetical protein